MGPDIQKILVPIDFSDYSKSALKYAVNFCKNCKADMFLIYVVEPVIYPPDFSMGKLQFHLLILNGMKEPDRSLISLQRKKYHQV